MAQNKQTNNKTLESDAPHHIFELFLFVNPIGKTCLNCEREVMQFVHDTNKKVYIRFIASNNFQVFSNSLKNKENKPHSLHERNDMYYSAHKIAMAFKAGLLQGRKKGRRMLMNMQEHFGKKGHPFSQDELIRIVKQDQTLDLDMWLEDISSPLTLSSYQDDQKLTKQMSIETTPTLVIFDNYNYQYGLKIDRDITAKNIEKVINHMYEMSKTNYHNQPRQKANLRCISKTSK